jgi:hypothetical protein
VALCRESVTPSAVMLSNGMPSVVLLSVAIPNVIIPSVLLLNVIILSGAEWFYAEYRYSYCPNSVIVADLLKWHNFDQDSIHQTKRFFPKFTQNFRKTVISLAQWIFLVTTKRSSLHKKCRSCTPMVQKSFYKKFRAKKNWIKY